MKKQTALVLSYVPLVDINDLKPHLGKAYGLGKDAEPADEWDSKVEKTNEDGMSTTEFIEHLCAKSQDMMPMTMGILWAIDGDNVHALMILEKGAKELLDNMNHWADGDISGRFKWAITSDDDVPLPSFVGRPLEEYEDKTASTDGYLFNIVADPKKSIERWLTANRLFGSPDQQAVSADSTDFKVISIPIMSAQRSRISLVETQAAFNEDRKESDKIDLLKNNITLKFGFVNISDITDEEGNVVRDKYMDYATNYDWLDISGAGDYQPKTGQNIASKIPPPSNN